jgi:hypothetical protein
MSRKQPSPWDGAFDILPWKRRRKEERYREWKAEHPFQPVELKFHGREQAVSTMLVFGSVATLAVTGAIVQEVRRRKSGHGSRSGSLSWGADTYKIVRMFQNDHRNRANPDDYDLQWARGNNAGDGYAVGDEGDDIDDLADEVGGTLIHWPGHGVAVYRRSDGSLVAVGDAYGPWAVDL